VKVLFWSAAGLLVYPYVVYPLLLLLLARLAPYRRASPAPMQDWPSVTVIVSAHNEAAVIEHKVQSTLACDYPAERLSVMVVSDASTDETNAIVARLAAENPAVRLLAMEEHRGKTAGLNLALERIDSELVVFTDANAVFDPAAIRRLAECFADPGVGYAVGAALYQHDEATAAGENEGLYWRYELAIKQLESEFHSVVGGDGAIYAIRRELYKPLAAEDINDFVNPMQIVAKGWRGVFRPDARAYEDPANDYEKEFRRRRRIVCRTWGALLRYGRDLHLTREPRFLFMLLSHKVIRWFTLVWLLAALAGAAALAAAGAGAVYPLALLALAALLGLAFAGWLRLRAGGSAPAFLSVPYYFVMSNYAAILGIFDYARGNRYVVWEHARLQ